LASLAKAVSIFRELVQNAPEEIRHSEQVLLGVFIASLNTGDLSSIVGDLDQAESSFVQARNDLLELLEIPSREARSYVILHTQILRRLAGLELSRGNIQRAKEYAAAQQAAYDKAMTMPALTHPGYKLAEDYALVGLCFVHAQIHRAERGRAAAAADYEEVLVAAEPFVAGNDPRMNVFIAASLIYLERRDEAERYLAKIRELGELPKPILDALDETEDSVGDQENGAFPDGAR
jgi:tetratricopeptide (TPR) repeat protein